MTTTTRRPVAIRSPRPEDLGWVVYRHGVVFGSEWGSGFVAVVAGIVADFARRHDAERERGWIAEVDGAAAGCVFCVRRDEETAQLRLLYVEPSARGFGLGSRLVDGCVDFAARAGYRKVVLWTVDELVSARRIYEAAGFRLTRAEPSRLFGHDVVSETWELDLTSTAETTEV